MRKILFFFLPLSLFAQMPAYYQGIDFTQSGEQIQADLSALIIATHSYELIYTPEVWDALKLADLDPENPQNVFLIYGYDDEDGDFVNDRTRDKDLSCHSSSCAGKWVREHVFPKSLGNPSFSNEGPGSDAHSIRAVDYTWNNSRSNRKFAEGEGHSHITDQGFFYPGDEWKGDVARMMMYMHLRYGNRCTANQVGVGTHTHHPDMLDIFLEWNAEDPVSEYEMVRNEVLQDMQGNRNPFIDNPYLATLIWGGDEADNTWVELSVKDEIFAQTMVYPNPSNGDFNLKSNKIIQSVAVFSMDGSKVSGQNLYRSEAQIHLEGLNEGVYILLIQYADKTYETRRIFVRK